MENFVNQMEEEIIKEEESILYEKLHALHHEEDELIRKKVKLRENTLKTQYDLFVTNKGIQDNVYLNIDLLHAVVRSYYDDIHRYKRFSDTKWANGIKQAAYTIKWISKFRPIQVNKGVYVSIDINLIFALLCGFSFLERETVALIMDEKAKIDAENAKGNDDPVNMSFYDNLLYTIRYRQVSGRNLISIFEALEVT